jgi:predicted Zn finger-like uncharacterized protein
MAMIVQCERCQTKFKLNDERVPKGGGKARCSKCQHIFIIEKPLTPGMETIEGLEVKEESVEIPKKVEEGFDEFLAKPEEGEEEVRQRRFPLKSMLALLVLFVVLGGGAFLYWDKLGEINWEILRMSNIRDYLGSRVSPDGNTILPKSQLRGYYIDNINAGRIFVIEGKAINNSSEVKGFIKVKGALFDSMGNKLAETEVYCGNILSGEELMELRADQINYRLNSPGGDPSVNMNIHPQKSIPFMVVFFDLSEDIKKFSVKLTGTEKAK